MYPSLIIPAVLITVYGHTPKNNSDVIVTYEGHAEAMNQAPILVPTTRKPETVTRDHEFIVTKPIPEIPVSKTGKVTDTTPVYEETESVVFIPNDVPVRRFDDYLENHADRMSIRDVMSRVETVNDVMNSQRVIVETEPPNQDILFITGKNKEHEDSFNKDKERVKDIPNSRRTNVSPDKKTVLQCTNLDCNNTVKSVCGGKKEHSQWRYRLFLNECFFRKVNCNFKYDENRFKQVPLSRCRPIGAHYPEPPPLPFNFAYTPPKKTTTTAPSLRRNAKFRRTLNVNTDGKFCSHPCPASCSEQYEPECAVSGHGQRRVFINHCKLDFHSCSYGTVWQRRPLAECVGGKKADMTRNSAFVGWMQKVGIVDNKGRLTLD